MEERTLAIMLNLLAAPFGLPAMYYGYMGYKVTKGGLKAYQYFFVAMAAVGAVLLFDLLFEVLGLSNSLGVLVEVAFLMAAMFFMFAFKDMYEFLRSVF
jgi:hypothetical protein